MDSKELEARSLMYNYWDRNCNKCDEKEMMQDDAAEQLGQEEIPEVLSYLPNLDDKDVLELGAGIGRFTRKVATKAHSVLAIDFMEKFVKKNQETNGHLPNVTIRQGDVMKLDLEPNSMDVVFSNWLLMYLTDEEVFELLQKILTWLRPGGHLFFRESCFRPAGNRTKKPTDEAGRKVTPTVFRSPKDYVQIIEVVATTNDNKHSCYEIVLQRPLQAYIKNKGNRDQMCWLMVKTSSDGEPGFKSSQRCLDDKLHERIQSADLVCSGSREETEDAVGMLNLRKDDHVLEIGCGSDNSAFKMAEDYGAQVLSIDTSANRVCTALDLLHKMNLPNLQFEMCDVMQRELPEASYDVVYINGSTCYVTDKKELFRRCLRWLKPGGHLLLIDFCSPVDEHFDEELAAFTKLKGYKLKSQKAYNKMLQDVGFLTVMTEDRTEALSSSLETDLTRAESVKNDFIREFSAEDFSHTVAHWRNKLKLVERGAILLGLFCAKKPEQASTL